jgi:flagellar hook-length control protein FliK
VRDGRTSARITLRPAELGEVHIRISYGAGGVTASMSTDSTRAAQILLQAGSELRQSLEERGFTLQGLDVQVGAEHRGPASDAESDADAMPATGETAKTDDQPLDPPTSPVAAPQLGVSIDVLA